MRDNIHENPDNTSLNEEINGPDLGEATQPGEVQGEAGERLAAQSLSLGEIIVEAESTRGDEDSGDTNGTDEPDREGDATPEANDSVGNSEDGEGRPEARHIRQEVRQASEEVVERLNFQKTIPIAVM